jgi:hypothetical protein
MTAKTRFSKSATFIFILAVAFMLSACEKVVSIDLNKAAPHLVIDGIVTDQQGPYTVTLSLSGSYFEPSLYFPPVSNALVIVTDDLGQRDTLKEVTSGTYLSTKLQGIAGRTYSLSVISDGKEYDGSSSMPQKVLIDSLYAVPRTGFGGESGFDIYVMFHDPPELGNYYRVNARSSALIPADSIDGRRYRLFSDKLTNGNEMAERIRAGRNVNPGDTITVELLSIDKAAYDYYSTLRDILSSDRSATSLSPANPITNLSNGPLGYFAAFTVDTKRIVLK